MQPNRIMILTCIDSGETTENAVSGICTNLPEGESLPILQLLALRPGDVVKVLVQQPGEGIRGPFPLGEIASLRFTTVGGRTFQVKLAA